MNTKIVCKFPRKFVLSKWTSVYKIYSETKVLQHAGCSTITKSLLGKWLS